MKRIKLILACGFTLALTGLTTLLVAAGASRDTMATVRSVQGIVTYRAPEGGDFKPVKANQTLPPGTTLRAGPHSKAYLSVNGVTSTVEVTENTTMVLTKMSAEGEDTTTTLKLDGGTLLGSVRKVSANSDYKVLVPGGVAAIRGTDWQVTVTDNGNGSFTVKFTSESGTVFCQVNLAPGTAGQASQNLTTGQSWTVTGTTSTTGVQTITTVTIPVTIPPAEWDAIRQAVQNLNDVVTAALTAAGPGPGTTTIISQPVPPTTNPSNTGGSQGGNSQGGNNQGGNNQGGNSQGGNNQGGNNQGG